MSKLYFVSCVLSDSNRTDTIPYNCTLPIDFESAESIEHQLVSHYLFTCSDIYEETDRQLPFPCKDTVTCVQIVCLCPIGVEAAVMPINEAGMSVQERLSTVLRILGVADNTQNSSTKRLLDGIAHVATDNDDSDLYDACAALMDECL